MKFYQKKTRNRQHRKATEKLMMSGCLRGCECEWLVVRVSNVASCLLPPSYIQEQDKLFWGIVWRKFGENLDCNYCSFSPPSLLKETFYSFNAVCCFIVVVVFKRIQLKLIGLLYPKFPSTFEVLAALLFPPNGWFSAKLLASCLQSVSIYC